jgi:thiamine-phosphate pyrophosphorylase
MMLDLSAYLVIGPEQGGDRGVLATIDAAAQGGLTAVQLRDKHASARQLVNLAGQLRRVLAGTGIRLFINDRLDVALAAGADGVHLGQSDLDVEQARRIAGPDFLIGLSASTEAQITRASALPAGTVDYLGIGPVFDTTTKADAPPGLGLAAVARLCSGTALPCVGIGGITAENAASVWSTGLAGLAVVSMICGAADPAKATARLLVGRSQPVRSAAR